MLYKVIILYFKSIIKGKPRSDAPPGLSLSLCDDLMCERGRCEDACVSMCSCAFRSAMICREHLRVTLLPNRTLSLLALLILRVFILKTKQKPSFAYTDLFRVWMNSTLTILRGIETPNTPAIFLAFGPFSSIIPCSSSLFQILHIPST